MAIKIAFAIQKGGQAKTTTSVITAEILARAGYNTLLIDLDSQANATTMVSGKSMYEFEGRTVYEAMEENDPLPYLNVPKDNLCFLAADDMMALFSRHIYTSGLRNPAGVLKRAISQVESEFDFIIMDCPPALSDIVTNAIVYADYIIMPMDAGDFGEDAIERFMKFVNTAKEAGHTKAEVLGILFTLRDTRSSHEKKIIKTISKQFPGIPFKAQIRKRAKIKEAAKKGVQLISKADDKVYTDYLNFVEELIERIARKEGGKNSE